MKSKISFFNKTIFWKNVTLYWPIWGIYTFALFLMQPATIWLSNNWGHFTEYTDAMKLRDLIWCLQFESYVWWIAITALVSGMALFHFMYNHKSANMIHALPVDRNQLYGTTVISGLAFLIVPQLVMAVMSTILCLVYAVPGIGYLWMWFLAAAALSIIAFSIVTICALFTGHIAVMPMYVVAVNLIPWVVYYLVEVVITTFAFGVTYLDDRATDLVRVFCPMECFYEYLTWNCDYSDMGNVESVTLEGTKYLVLYLVLAIIFYVSAYVIYRKRKIEQAGDFLTVNWVKPIFRVVVSIFGAIYGALLVRQVLMETSIGCGIFLFVCLLVVIGGVFYFAADMFIKKSFHVFKKSNWMRCGISSAIVALAFFGMYGLSGVYEKEVPELEDIRYAEIRLGYQVTLFGEQAEPILEIQKAIQEQADFIEENIDSRNYYYNSVRISYVLHDGTRIERYYPVLEMEENEELEEIFYQIKLLESNEENFLVNTFGRDYANVSTFYTGALEGHFIEPEDREKEDCFAEAEFGTKKLNEEQTKELYYALIEDVKAGTLMKYNVYNGKYIHMEDAYVDYYWSSEVLLYLEYESPTANEPKAESSYAVAPEDEYYKSPNYVYVYIGPDCTNVVNKLVELGIIESVEHLWWSAAEDMLK